MFANAVCSDSRPIVVDAACLLMSTLWVASSCDVDSMSFDVVVLSAVIWSRTSFWFASAWATIDRGPQRGDRRRRRPVDALDELEVVLPDEVDREVALDRDRLLGQQVLVLLAHVEQHVVAQRLRPLGIGRLDLGDLRGERGVESLGDVDVLGEPLHRLPEMHLLLLERRVVLAQLVLAVVERLDDRVDVRLRALVLAEVVARSCRRTGSSRGACLAPVACFGSRSSIVRRRSISVAGDLGALAQRTVLHRAHRRREQPVRRLGRRTDVVVAHRGDVARPSRRTRASGRRGRRCRRRTRRPWRRGPAPPRRRSATMPSALLGATAATGAGGVSVSSPVAAGGGVRLSGVDAHAHVLFRSRSTLPDCRRLGRLPARTVLAPDRSGPPAPSDHCSPNRHVVVERPAMASPTAR